MCGRFALFTPTGLLEEYFELTESVAAELEPRYNVTPGQAVAVVREREGVRRVDSLRWGLVPFWAKDATIGRRLINARLESASVKPAFREAWSRRRCLIPASGFYEWAEPHAGRRQPFFIRARQEPLLAMAGLWERWRSPSGETLETCVIVTTDANDTLAPIHDRMPVLVPQAEQRIWLDASTTRAEIDALARHAPALDAWPVGFAVNDPRRDDEALTAPAEDAR